MSHFKRMVEAQIQQIMHQPEPTVLTDGIKQQVLSILDTMTADDFLKNMKEQGIVSVLDIPQEKLADSLYLRRLELEIEVWLTTLY